MTERISLLSGILLFIISAPCWIKHLDYAFF